MSDDRVNLFDKSSAICVLQFTFYCPLRKKSCLTVDVNWNKQNCYFCQGTDLHEQVTRHLKTFKMSNKMIISLLVTCWWYFSCLQNFVQFFLKKNYIKSSFLLSMLGYSFIKFGKCLTFMRLKCFGASWQCVISNRCHSVDVWRN